MHDVDYHVLFFSISVKGVRSQCVIAAPSTGCPFRTHHPSPKESVIAALMTLQLNAKMKVRLRLK